MVFRVRSTPPADLVKALKAVEMVRAIKPKKT